MVCRAQNVILTYCRMSQNFFFYFGQQGDTNAQRLFIGTRVFISPFYAVVEPSEHKTAFSNKGEH